MAAVSSEDRSGPADLPATARELADPLKLGYDQMAMIGVKCEADRMLEAADAIAAFDEVIYVVATAGAWDLMVEVVCVNNEDLLRFLTEKLHPAD